MQTRPTLGLLIAMALLAAPVQAGTRVVTLLDNVSMVEGDLHMPSIPTLQAKRFSLFGRANTGSNVAVRCGFSLDPATDPSTVESVANVAVARFVGSAALGVVEPKVLTYEVGQAPSDIAGPNLACTLTCTGVNPPGGPLLPCGGTVTLKVLLLGR